jgi:hypothetical protein
MKAGSYALGYRERLSRKHRESILLLAATQNKVSTGEVNDFLNSYLDTSERMTYRSVQNWLTKLCREGVLRRDKYGFYSLASQNLDIRHLGDLIGQLNLKNLMKKPLSSSDPVALQDLVIRFGFLVVWSLLLLSRQSTEQGRQKSGTSDDSSFILASLPSSVPLVFMYAQLMKRFGRSHEKHPIYSLDTNRTNELMHLLLKAFPENTLPVLESATEVLRALLPTFKQQQDESLEVLGLLISKATRIDE